jgi:hypothetical protein
MKKMFLTFLIIAGLHHVAIAQESDIFETSEMQIESASEAPQESLSVLSVSKIAAQYVYEGYLKPVWKKVVAVFVAQKKKEEVER